MAVVWGQEICLNQKGRRLRYRDASAGYILDGVVSGPVVAVTLYLGIGRVHLFDVNVGSQIEREAFHTIDSDNLFIHLCSLQPRLKGSSGIDFHKGVRTMLARARFGILTTAVVLLGLILATVNSLAAETVDYPERDITIIVPTRPGGGIDGWTRLVAAFLPKYLPKRTNIVVENLVSGGYQAAINKVLRSKPDGYTLAALFLPGNALDQVLGLASYDLRQLKWLGGYEQEGGVVITNSASRFKSLKDMQSSPTPLKMAVSSFNTPYGAGSVIAAERLGLKVNFIPQQGVSNVVLAVMRGDADFGLATHSGAKSGLESKDLKPLWVYDKERVTYAPGVPTITNLGYPDLVEIFSSTAALVVNKDVSGGISTMLQEAVKKVVSDPEYTQKMKAMNALPHYTSPEELNVLVNKSLEMYKVHKETVSKLMKN